MKTTLEEYLAFKTVVDTGSITRAAAHLGLTTSGVSRALTRLEKKLNTTLLNRTTRRLELTDEGKHLLVLASAILASVAQLEEQLALRQNKPSGVLRVNSAASFMRLVIVPLIPEFRQKFPAITLELDTNDRYIDLIEQHTDVAIRIGTLEDSSLHARLLGHSQLRILASPTYLKQHGTPTTVIDLMTHNLLGFNEIDALNNWPLLTDTGAQFSIVPALSASSADTLMALALADQGIVCLSDFSTRQAIGSGQLVELFTAQRCVTKLPINAVYYRHTQLSLRITAFLDFIAAHIPKDL